MCQPTGKDIQEERNQGSEIFITSEALRAYAALNKLRFAQLLVLYPRRFLLYSGC
jgi:hypothetical protein